MDGVAEQLQKQINELKKRVEKLENEVNLIKGQRRSEQFGGRS